MRNALAIAVLLLCSCSQQKEYRDEAVFPGQLDARWGMTKQEVKDIYPMAEGSANVLSWRQRVLTIKSRVAVRFTDNDRLDGLFVIFEDEVITVCDMLRTIFIDNYGMYRDVSEGTEGYSKDETWDKIKTGQYSPGEQWTTMDRVISLHLQGSEGTITLIMTITHR